MSVGGMFGNVTSHPRAKVSVTITAVRNLDALYIPTETFNDIIKVIYYILIIKKLNVLSL